MNATNVEKLRKSVLEKASLVRDAAYNVEDPECLKEVLKNLAQVHSSLLNKIPNEGGIRMRTSPAKKRLRVSTMDYHKVFHKTLPLRRRRKTEIKEEHRQQINNHHHYQLTWVLTR